MLKWRNLFSIVIDSLANFCGAANRRAVKRSQSVSGGFSATKAPKHEPPGRRIQSLAHRALMLPDNAGGAIAQSTDRNGRRDDWRDGGKRRCRTPPETYQNISSLHEFRRAAAQSRARFHRSARYTCMFDRRLGCANVAAETPHNLRQPVRIQDPWLDCTFG